MEKDYILGFSLSPLGPKKFQKAIGHFKSAEAAWEGSEKKYEEIGIVKKTFESFENFRRNFDFIGYEKKINLARVEFIPFGDEYYPQALVKLSDPPIGLFIKGNKKLLLADKRIGVVGARKITSYGQQVTETLVGELCSSGFVIVSGMALGVDGIAHKAAVDSKSPTIAVLGCGVDCPYPKENEKLYEEILDSGGLIISEYPLGMCANRGTFPARNRIIAALSLAVLITEAAEDSGSLITAGFAIEQGKKVFAVPGPITSQMSKGTLKLLKNSAVLVSSIDDILQGLNVKTLPQGGMELRSKISNLSKEEKKILDCLENEERTIDEIAKLTNIKIDKLLIIVSEMELAGLIKNSDGRFTLREQ